MSICISVLKESFPQGDYSKDQEVEVGVALQYHLTDLREYTEYTFWVSAYNENGEGAFSEEIPCRTYSDTPADPPQNVTIESASSSSIIGELKKDLMPYAPPVCALK